MEENVDYKGVMEIIELSGAVTSGFKKGKYFVSQKEYQSQIERLLKFTPYPGTLNLQIIPEDLPKITTIRQNRGILIEHFTRDEREFGYALAYKATINGTDCAIIMPEMSSYTDIIEIISTWDLRQKLNLTDGKIVKVVVSFNKSD
jgi:riboflavin kinase